MNTQVPQTELVQRALTTWGMDDATYRHIGEYPETSWLIQHYKKNYKLRIHYPDFHSRIEILSEHEMIRALNIAGIRIPKIIPTPFGERIFEFDGRHVDITEYFQGRNIGDGGRLFATGNSPELLRIIGTTLAKIHIALDNWAKPSEFVRPKQDADGLLGQTTRWKKFWESPILNRIQHSRLSQFRRSAVATLLNIQSEQDFGLIHNGLAYEKLIRNENEVYFVNTSDCCFGFRLMDLAALTNQCRNEKNSDRLIECVLNGYTAERAIDTRQLPLFQALNACIEVALLTRITNYRQQHVRNERLLKQAEELISEWEKR